VNRQQLLVDSLGHRVQPRAAAIGEDDSFAITASYMKSGKSNKTWRKLSLGESFEPTGALPEKFDWTMRTVPIIA